MKPLVQKLPLDDSSSFIARTYRTPHFETPWHKHEEVELLLFTKGEGDAFVGNYMGEFSEGDVYLLGSGLPHWFKAENPDMMNAAIVVQFNENMFGKGFLTMPELSEIKMTLEDSKKGLWLHKNLGEQIIPLIKKMEVTVGFERLTVLLEALYLISQSSNFQVLSQYYSMNYKKDDEEKIALVFEYCMNNFQENITLQQMADLTHQSVSNFCKYFKISTRKTFTSFLNEIRISHACKLLKSTNLTISEICYESGFRNWANFSKHFKTIKSISPKVYRKEFRG